MTERRRTNSLELTLVVMAMTVAVCSAQTVTSAHSGTLHYFEGDVSVDGTPVQSKAGRFSEITEQSVLRTVRGRAEVLLTPGVFLRVAENGAIKMLDNRLLSTRLEILSGTVIVESDDPQMSIKDPPVALIYKNYVISLVKHGLVEISSDPGQVKVFKGEAIVDTTSASASNGRATVGQGRVLSLSRTFLTERFNDKVGDDLYLWARDRSQSLAAANMSSARSLSSSGSGNGDASSYWSGGGSGSGNWNGGWYFNPYFNMYTFVPAGGIFWNPWGFGFYSPATISSYYTHSTYWYGGGGARGTGSIGRPLSGTANPTATQAAPLSSLRGGNSGGLSTIGSPVRTGAAMGGSRVGFASTSGGAGGGHGGGHGH